MEKDKNETNPERKSDTPLKGTVISFIILLILVIAAFLCEKIDNDILTILMAIISAIAFFGAEKRLWLMYEEYHRQTKKR